jgi:DNA-binding NarL/FixJ family response regulator
MPENNLCKPVVRILVVDDFEKWRRSISTQLQARPDLLVVGEASNGWEAIRKAELLKPDLILLDVGLQGMNGIMAASLLGHVAPDSKILFVSLHDLPAMVRAAFTEGARGYLVKSRVAKELLRAIDQVLSGNLFVDTEISSSDSTDDGHLVQFYEDDRSLTVFLNSIVTTALRSEQSVIMIATKVHRDALNEQLRSHGIDVHVHMRDGTYIVQDANEILSCCMHMGNPDPYKFDAKLSPLIRQAQAANPTGKVVVFGEMGPLVLADGNHKSALWLEQFGSELARTDSVSIRCAYPANAFSALEDRTVCTSICAEHSAIVGA